jgi:nitrate/TMAO reductase-like tetraheme cytochrome c subunit
MVAYLLVGLGVVNLGLLALLVHNWNKSSTLIRFALSGVVFLWFPLFWGLSVVSQGLNNMKTVDFCNSCHVMEAYTHSLNVDDEESLPAIHYQNNYVDRATACYDCHTEYTMFGDVKAKIGGLKHVWVNYFGTIPENIELYKPYQNRDCEHCHGTAKNYLETHEDDLQDIKNGEYSCLDCHDVGHVLKDVTR